jgi:predicted transcriptional regulator
MTNNNKSKTDTVIQILEKANDNDITQTKLMSKIFHKKMDLKVYITELVHDDLLSYDAARRTLKTTQKGLTLLRAYYQVNKILKGYQI